jgi:hypothetical protein
VVAELILSGKKSYQLRALHAHGHGKGSVVDSKRTLGEWKGKTKGRKV